MIYLLKILHYLKHNSWSNILLFILSIYCVGATLLLIEPETFDGVGTYTWWFIVTSSTVGYGDVFPTTGWGRLIGVITIFGGVGSLAMVIGKLSELVMNLNKIKIKGLKSYKMKDHIVLMGYHQEETNQIIGEILKDEKECRIVVCTDEVEENPLIQYECVSFVRGKLISDDVLNRACVKDASKILIHAPDDDQSIAVLLAVLNTNDNPNTNIVLTMNCATYNRHVEQMVERMDRCVETVTDLKTPMMIQSLLDSGSSDIVNQMLSNDGSAIRSIVYTGDSKNFEFMSLYMRDKEAILIGVNGEFHPSRDRIINNGDVLYYFAKNRYEVSDFPKTKIRYA